MASRGRYNYALMTNKHGSTVSQGMSLIPDSANDLSFKMTTTAGDLRIFASVTDETIADSALGLIQLFGSIVEELQTSAAVTRGHYIKQGTTAGKVIDTTTMADATTTPPAGSIGIALTGVGGAGTIAAFIFPAQPASSGGVTAFTGLSDVPASYSGQALKSLRVNAGATAIEFFTPATAANVVSTYNPDLPPTSPSAYDDEFNAGSLDVKWVNFGSPDTVSVTDYKGYLHLTRTGTSVTGGVYQAFVPGAAAFTIACKVIGTVAAAGSNQVLLVAADSSTAFIADIGMLNAKDAIVGAAALSGGFDDFTLPGGPTGFGTYYYALCRDSGTNYTAYISKDGILWSLLSSFSQAGTVARIAICCAAFSASTTEAYFDWVRVFTTQTRKIGNSP